jgi:hypothetical protein
MPLAPGPAGLATSAACNALGFFSVDRLGGGSVLAHSKPWPMKAKVSSSR